MTDLEIIKNYKNGSLSGITLAEHCLFMPVRISGTGLTYRLNEDLTKENLANYFEKDSSTSLEELIEICKQSNKSLDDFIVYQPYDRDLDDFANDDILTVYQGLPILKNHPHTEEGKPCLLNFYNLQDNNIIGSIIQAYRLDDAIWGLARIYDISLLEFLESKYSSTSPAVRSIDIEKDGIISEKPYIFNHLAFVDEGHWDIVDKKPYDAEKLNIIINDNLLSNKGVLMKNSEDDDIKTDSSTEKELSEDVSELKEAEKKEAQQFKELAEDHNKIDTEKGEDKVEKDLKIDNEVSENSISKDLEEVKTDEVENKVDDTEETSKEKVKTDEVENKVDDTEETSKEDDKTDDDIEIVDEVETLEDEERDTLVDNFREAIDCAHPSLNLKMPYMGNKRLKPTVAISKILKANKDFVDSKYRGLLIESDDRSEAMYSLKVDAYNDMLKNIQSKTENLRKTAANKKGFWAKTDKSNVLIDRNF